MRVILLGAPGAGKGTQAIRLAAMGRVPHISTGDMMRESIRQESELGKKVKDYLDRGDLVPDSVVVEMIRQRLGQADAQAGFVLDGFPRTVDQARALTTLLSELGLQDVRAIEVRVPEEELLRRIRQRGEQASGRSDDSDAVAAHRLQVYWQQTYPAIEFYREQGCFVSIDGVGSVEEVQERLQVAAGLKEAGALDKK